MADRYFVNGGVDSNWGSTSNWSATNGGTGGASVPTSSDDVFFTSLSPSCVINTLTRSCSNINCTGYTGTLDFQAQLSPVGGAVFSPTMSVIGSSALNFSGNTITRSIQSNGFVWPISISMSGNNNVFNLLDDVIISGDVSLGSGTGTTTFNDHKLICMNNLTFGTSTGIVTGTSEIVVGGSGVLTCPSSTGLIRSQLTFDTTGSITVASASGNLNYNTGTLKYVSGDIDISGIQLNCTSIGGTLAVSGLMWDSVNFAGVATYTLAEELNTTSLNLGVTTGTTTIDGEAINVWGNIRQNSTTGNILGTSTIHIKDTSYIDAPSVTTGDINNRIIIEAGAGTVTFDSRISVDIGQVQYLSGTVITDAGTWASGGGNTYSRGRIVNAGS